MRRFSVFALLVFAAACGKSPRQYVDAGNGFFKTHKYDDASINYRKAIQKDANFPEAYYGLGQTYLQQGKLPEAYAALTRAVQLAPQNFDAKQKLANLVLAGYLRDRRRPKNLYDQLNQLADQFLKHDAGSYDGLRLKAYITLNDNQRDVAIGYFRKALQTKPSDPEMTTVLGEILLQDRGTAGEGEKLLLDLIQKSKEMGAAYDVLYRYYSSAKRPAEAENILKAKVTGNPKQPAFLLQLAEHYRRAAKIAEMKATVAVLLSDAKAFPKGLMMAGDFYNQAGDREQALKYYQQGAQTAADDRLAYQKRSVGLLSALGRSDQALSLIEESLRANPKDSDLHMARALIWLNQAKTDAALAELQAQDQEHKSNPVVKYQLGRALLLKGKAGEATAAWQEAARLRPDFLEPKIALAGHALDLRRFDEAQRWADQIVSVSPNNVAAQLLRASALQGLGRQAEAKTLLTTLRQQLPDNQAVDLEYAFFTMRQNQPAEAEKIFRKHYAPGQENLRPLTGLVQTLFLEKRADEALRLLQADLAKTPGRASVQMMLANAFVVAGQADSAIHTLDQMAAAHPDNAQVRMRLGEIQTSKGNQDGAIANFQKAHELAPQSVNPLLSLAEAEEHMGRFDSARQYYQSALKLEPANPVALNNFAYLTADTGGNLDEAMRMIKAASQKLPQQPNLSDTLGYVYLKQKRVTNALQVFGDLTRHYPDNPTFRFHHALALLESGSKEQARKELEAALAGKPPADLATKIRQALGGAS